MAALEMEGTKTKAVAPCKVYTAPHKTSGDCTAIALVESAGGALVDSRVLAAHLGNTHQSVRELLQDHCADFEEFGPLRFQTGMVVGRGSGERYALLNEEQAYLLLTYSRNTERVRPLKVRLVKAFRAALDAAQPPALNLSDPASLRTALLGYTERVIELEGQLSVAEPKAQALDRLSASGGALTPTNAAKVLKITPKALFAWLRDMGWTYRRSDQWVAHYRAIDRRVLEHKASTYMSAGGAYKTKHQVMVTPKGMAELAERMNAGAS